MEGLWDGEWSTWVGTLRNPPLKSLLHYMLTNMDVNLGKEKKKKINKSRPTPGHIIVKFAKYRDTEKILKGKREKKSITYKARQIMLDLSTKSWQT